MRAPILEGPQPGALCGQVGGRIGDEGPLEARLYTVSKPLCAGRKGCRKW